MYLGRENIHIIPIKVKILLSQTPLLYSYYSDDFPDSPPEIKLHVIEFLVHGLSWSPLQFLLGVVDDVGVLLQGLRGPEIQSWDGDCVGVDDNNNNKKKK